MSGSTPADGTDGSEDPEEDPGTADQETAAEGDLIDRLPGWLVSRDEGDMVISKRLDRAIRFVATYFP